MTHPIAPILNEGQIQRLNTVAALGAEKVAESLSKWIRTKIVISSTKASVMHYSKLTELSPSSEGLSTAILVRVSGSVSGYLVFIFDENSTKHILGRILRRDIDSLAEWDNLRRSAMEETGNIIGTSFANALAMNLGLEIHPSSPVMAFDFPDALWDTLLTQYALEGEYALSCQITLNSQDHIISGIFSVIPDDLQSWKAL
ncbi:MAG TPA: hypothetical protein VFF47_04030 [Nitrospirota bacterium]|nr:hypothetical protein [Nitrospirota bacterium]